MQSVRLGGGAFGLALPKKRFMAAVPRRRSWPRQRRQRSRPTRNPTAGPEPHGRPRPAEEGPREAGSAAPSHSCSLLLGGQGGDAFLPQHIPRSQGLALQRPLQGGIAPTPAAELMCQKRQENT